MALPNVHALSKSRANKVAFRKQLLKNYRDKLRLTSTPLDVITVPISLPIIIVSEDLNNKLSDIYTAPTLFFHRAQALATTVLLRSARRANHAAHRHWRQQQVSSTMHLQAESASSRR